MRDCVAFTVRIRRDFIRAVRAEAEQMDGKVYDFERGWEMDEDDPYPGEVAWIVVNGPKDGPLWIASGDLVPVEAP